MKVIQRVFWAQMLVAVAALAIGYARAGHPIIALTFVLMGSLWLSAQQRSATAIEGLLLTVFCLAAGTGLWLGVPGWLALLTVVACLGAWDLDHFLQRLSLVERVEYESGLGREHLRRLAIVQGIGLLAGLVGLSIHVRIPFWWEALLVLLAILGIRQIVHFVRKQMNE